MRGCESPRVGAAGMFASLLCNDRGSECEPAHRQPRSVQTPGLGMCMLPGMRHLLGASAVLSLFVFGCGSDGGNTGDDDQQPDASVETPPGFTRLVGRTWTLAAGQKDT